MPRARAAWMVPIAVSSLNAKIAVGGSGNASREAAASRPGSISGMDSTSSAGLGRMPAEASAARYPRRRSSVASQPLGPVICAMRRCPSSSRWRIAWSAPEVFAAETLGGGNNGRREGSEGVQAQILVQAKGGFAVALSRRNLLIAVGVVLAVSAVVLIALFAGGGSGGGGGGVGY